MNYFIMATFISDPHALWKHDKLQYTNMQPLKLILFSQYIFLPVHTINAARLHAAESLLWEIFYPEAIMKSSIEGNSPGGLTPLC